MAGAGKGTSEKMIQHCPVESPAILPKGRMNKSGKNRNGYGKGTFIDTKMFLSGAFLSLGQPGSGPFVSSVSVQILMMFLGKRQYAKAKIKGQNVIERIDDNKFTLTYKEITSYGCRLEKNGNRVKGAITQPRATRGIDELLAKGFIEIAEHGGAYEKHKSKYSLVDNWMNWRIGDAPVRRRGKDCWRGFQGKKLGVLKQIIAHTNVAHPHTHERCIPHKEADYAAGLSLILDGRKLGICPE